MRAVIPLHRPAVWRKTGKVVDLFGFSSERGILPVLALAIALFPLSLFLGHGAGKPPPLLPNLGPALRFAVYTCAYFLCALGYPTTTRSLFGGALSAFGNGSV